MMRFPIPMLRLAGCVAWLFCAFGSGCLQNCDSPAPSVRTHRFAVPADPNDLEKPAVLAELGEGPNGRAERVGDRVLRYDGIRWMLQQAVDGRRLAAGTYPAGDGAAAIAVVGDKVVFVAKGDEGPAAYTVDLTETVAELPLELPVQWTHTRLSLHHVGAASLIAAPIEGPGVLKISFDEKQAGWRYDCAMSCRVFGRTGS